MPRNKFLGVKLNESEESALKLWADNEVLDKSVLARRILMFAIRTQAPRSIFPDHIATALNIHQEVIS